MIITKLIWKIKENYFFLIQRLINTKGFQECFIGENIPKQSSSFSSPREMNGSASLEEREPELTTDGSDLEARSCCMTLKYSSSVFALAKRDWALVL